MPSARASRRLSTRMRGAIPRSLIGSRFTLDHDPNSNLYSFPHCGQQLYTRKGTFDETFKANLWLHFPSPKGVEHVIHRGKISVEDLEIEDLSFNPCRWKKFPLSPASYARAGHFSMINS